MTATPQTSGGAMRPRRGSAARAAVLADPPRTARRVAPDPAVESPLDAPPTRPDLRSLPGRQVAATRVPAAVYRLLVAAIIAIGVFGIVTLQALAAEASFDAHVLETEIDQLTLEHDDLRARVAALGTPRRVRDVATRDLGLIQAEQPGFLTIDPASVWPDTPREIPTVQR